MALPTRTQIYLSEHQRRELDRLARQRNVSLAAVVRDAVDAYLLDDGIDAGAALDVTFGAAPRLRVPSRDGWSRG